MQLLGSHLYLAQTGRLLWTILYVFHQSWYMLHVRIFFLPLSVNYSSLTCAVAISIIQLAYMCVVRVNMFSTNHNLVLTSSTNSSLRCHRNSFGSHFRWSPARVSDYLSLCCLVNLTPSFSLHQFTAFNVITTSSPQVAHWFINMNRLNSRQLVHGRGVHEEQSVASSRKSMAGMSLSEGTSRSGAPIRFNVDDSKVSPPCWSGPEQAI